MDAVKPIDADALVKLKAYRTILTDQQYKVLRGQVLSGDADGAMKGLRRLTRRATKV